MKKIAHFCVAASFALPSAAIAALDVKSSNCSEQCVVMVTVSGAGCGGGISVSPEPLIFVGRGEKHIEWQISPSSPWSFVANRGINVNLKGKEFEDVNVGGGKKYKLKNKNTTPGTYKYDINLTDGKNSCNLDPTIMNY